MKYLSPEGSAPKPEQPKVEKQEARTPVEDPDTLKSHSYARIVDMLCEGPIAGFCNKKGHIIGALGNLGKAIYLDETPLQNQNGKFNFKGVTLGCQLGTQDQDALPGFGKAEDVIYRGIEIKKGLPVLTAITNPDAERIEVAVRLPSMLEQDPKTGDVHGSRVEYDVEVELNGEGTFTLLQHVLISGKCSSPYVHTTTHMLPQGTTPGENNWQIRVKRTTDNPPNLKVSNQTILDYITVVTRNKFAYPNSVLVAAEIDAKGFSSIPNRGFHVKGLLVKVPSNYFPKDRDQDALYNRDPITGDGVFDIDDNPIEQPWDGSFYTAWTNNPVWCVYDLITNKRYGLGDYIPQSRVDKWSFYTSARYCDELVDDGHGSLEPRFQCNAYIQNREEAWKVLQDFCSVFRGMAYYASGAVVVAQDRPQEVVAVFTNANVLEGIFAYSGTSKKARHTVVAVRWNDPDDFYRPKSEYVEDPDGIERYGVNQLDLVGFACTSRGQAHRIGKWVLESELHLTDTCSFRAGAEGMYIRPGDVVGVLDNDRAGAPLGGRLLAIADDGLSVTLDRNVTIPAGETKIHIARPRANLEPGEVTDSTEADQARTQQLETYTITNAPGETNVITFADAISATIAVAAVWTMQTAEVAMQLFRVINIEEQETGKSYAISGLEFLNEKFDAIEGDLDLEEPDITELRTDVGEVPYVNNLVLERKAIVRPTGTELVIQASWEEPPDYLIDQYIVEVRIDDPGEPWRIHERTNVLGSRIPYTLPGTYLVAVTAVNGFGAQSLKQTASITIADVNPFDLYSVTGLELVGQGNDTDFIGRDARFEWRLNSPANSQEFGSPVITSGQDPLFKDYVVVIKDADSGTEIYRETVLDPFFVFTYVKNSEADGGPRNRFKIEVRGRDRYNNLTDPATLTVSNPAPPAPSALAVTSSFKSIFLQWMPPAAFDLDKQLIYQNTVNNFATATVIATVSPTTSAHTISGLASGTAYYFWVVAVDTFGTAGPRFPAGGGISTVTGTVETTDLSNFAVDVTKMFTNTIALQGDQWTNNSPAAGRLAWNGHNIVFRGVITAIAAGNTPTVADKWIWWRGPIYTAGVITTPAENVYRTSTTHPKDTGAMLENDFIIATNTGGVVDLAWRAIANALIGSAAIRDLAVTNAKINDLAVDKLTAGTIFSQAINIAGTGIIKSDNYVTGVSGWQVKADGSAEFSDITARGTLAAGTIFTDAKLATSDFSNRNFLAVTAQSIFSTAHNFHWGGSAQAAISVNGASATLKNILWMDQSVAGEIAQFYGRGYAVSAPYVDAYRLATANPTVFYSLRYGQSGSGGKVSILYRTYTGSRPADDDLGNPWNLVTLTHPKFSSFAASPSFGFFTVAVPDAGILEIAVAPIDDTASGTGTTDILSDIRAVFQVQNF